MSEINRPIVCFAGCDWWYHNRGLFVAQIMTRLSRETKVLFINSLGMRIPNLKKDKDALNKIFRKFRSIMRFIKKVSDKFYVISLISIPFKNERLKTLNRVSVKLQIKLIFFILNIKQPIYYIGSLPAWELVKATRINSLIYECTDIFEEMPGIDKDYFKKLNIDLIKNASLVLYVNSELLKKGLKLNKNSLFIGHGVDYELFSTASGNNYTPDDLINIPKPMVGFYGDINEDWCDFNLIAHAADTLPDVSFVFVGPVSSDVSNLKKYNNIYFLGKKEYEEIPHYGKTFDVLMMPWNQNDWIRFCNPVKTKEYLALGKPIVSTDYPELKTYYSVVYVAKDYDHFCKLIKNALKEKSNKFIEEKRRQFVINETWDAKINLLKQNILTNSNYKK